MADEAVRTEVDLAGGGGIGVGSQLQDVLRDQGKFVAVFGEVVEDHGDGPHDSATMQETNNVLRLKGLLACRRNDRATCLHTASGSGVLRLRSP